MKKILSPGARLDAIGAICREFRIESLAPQLAAASEALRSGGAPGHPG